MKIEERKIRDGIYLVPRDAVVIQMTIHGLRSTNQHAWDWGDEDTKLLEAYEELAKFAFLYPDWRVASAYETGVVLMLSCVPLKAEVTVVGSGFNYGSTNVIRYIPAQWDLLILAQND